VNADGDHGMVTDAGVLSDGRVKEPEDGLLELGAAGTQSGEHVADETARPRAGSVADR